MKRLAVLFIGILLASTILPSLAVVAQPRLVPCENPATAQSSIDSLFFLTQYFRVFTLISSEQYANASKLSQELSFISMPPYLSYILNRYNNLTEQFVNVLSQLQATLDNASSLLNQNRLDEAAASLDEAGVLAAQAEILLSELQDATTTLGQQLGVLAAPAASKVAQEYDSLQSLMQRLSVLVNEYETLLQNASNQEQNMAKKLEPTVLTLNLNATNVFVGGYIAASGVLSSNGQVLPNRNISILLSGMQVATAVTDTNGSFDAMMTIPYTYVHVMAAQAMYTPTGGDANVYSASLSSAVPINVNFYLTELNMSAADVAYPALPLIVSGLVTSQAGIPLSGRTVKLLFDNSTASLTQSDSKGYFSTQMMISSQALIGSHSLKVTVDAAGVYAGVDQQKTLRIQQMVSTVNVQAPSFVLLPTAIQISGTVNSNSGLLNNANVSVEFDSNSVVTETLKNGSFNVRMKAPLNAGFGGIQSLKVTVKPQQPWEAVTQEQTNVFVLNAVGLGFALVSSVSVGFVTYSRFTKSKAKKELKNASRNALVLPSSEAAGPNASPKPEFKLRGAKGKVLQAYVKALKSVESATGNSLRLDVTLREFLQESEPKLGEAAAQFGQLTRMAEKALYSSHTPEEQDLSKAGELLSEIGRSLGK